MLDKHPCSKKKQITEKTITRIIFYLRLQVGNWTRRAARLALLSDRKETFYTAKKYWIERYYADSLFWQHQHFFSIHIFGSLFIHSSLLTGNNSLIDLGREWAYAFQEVLSVPEHHQTSINQGGYSQRSLSGCILYGLYKQSEANTLQVFYLKILYYRSGLTYCAAAPSRILS